MSAAGPAGKRRGWLAAIGKPALGAVIGEHPYLVAEPGREVQIGSGAERGWERSIAARHGRGPAP